MPEENVSELEIEEELTAEETDFSEEELSDESTDWKAKALELKGLNKRRATKLRKAKELLEKPPESKPPETTPPEKPKEEVSATQKALENSETALLIAHGLKTPEERALFQKAKKSTGAEIDEVLGDEFFQSKLKNLREENASGDAIPAGSKSSTTSPKSSVDHWIAKEELPPNDGTTEAYELRKAVVKKKKEIAESASNLPGTAGGIIVK